MSKIEDHYSHGLWTPNDCINQRYLKNWADVVGRQNMHWPYLKIWDWDLIFGRAVKAISSLGVRSPWSKVSADPIRRIGSLPYCQSKVQFLTRVSQSPFVFKELFSSIEEKLFYLYTVLAPL